MVSKRSGKIINISSMWGLSGASCEVAYSASKSGINGFTKALAKELAPSNVQVNAIACGVIDTSMNDQLTPEERKAWKMKFLPDVTELLRKLPRWYGILYMLRNI